MLRGAIISECGRYRYHLHRVWKEESPRIVTWIMLNPSTADADIDDPTIRRCVGFARSWGYDGIEVINLFPFRATKPADLKKADDPVGPLGDYYLEQTCRQAGAERLLLCAWGAHGGFRGRDKEVGELLSEYTLHALELTKKQQPRHPLYLKGSLEPFEWSPARGTDPR